MRPSSPEHQTDEALMAAFAGGDVRAFDELYRRYERRLFGFCHRLLGDADAAADAFQDAFVRVVDLRCAYQDSGRFRAWLFTIARNLCIDRLRKQRTWVSWHDAGTRGSYAVSVERAVEARDMLARALHDLSPEQREVILLHKYHGFSHTEIAAMTGSTEAAVKQKMYRALVRLRRNRPREANGQFARYDDQADGV